MKQSCAIGSVLYALLLTLLLPICGSALAAEPPLMRIALNGVQLVHSRSGQGPLVVFVHGELADYRFWEGQRDAVSSHYGFVSYSLRHHYPNTPSANTTASVTANATANALDSHVADLAALIRTLSPTSVHLVGHSLGANIVLRLALDHPDLTRSVTLVEPVPIDTGAVAPAERRALLLERQRMRQLNRGLVRNGSNAAIAKVLRAESDLFGALPPWVEAMARANNMTQPQISELVGAAIAPDLPCSALAQIRRPTMIVTGSFATDVMRASNDRLAECISQSKHVLLPGGHLMNVREPQAFNRMLQVFLAGLRGTDRLTGVDGAIELAASQQVTSE